MAIQERVGYTPLRGSAEVTGEVYHTSKNCSKRDLNRTGWSEDFGKPYPGF